MTESGIVKACISCGKQVNGQKRMKDSQGKYWCMECGAEDQRKKLMSSGGGSLCGGCGETFPAHQLSKWGSRQLCTSCSRSQSKGPGAMQTIKGLFAGSGGGQNDKGKLIKLGVVVVLLVLVVIWQHTSK